MSVFLAAIYVCLNNECVFIQSVETFNSYAECIVDTTREIRALKQKHPSIKQIDGACLEITFKGA
jgi:hypothetical protein